MVARADPGFSPWQCRARAYNSGLGSEPQRGFRGRAPLCPWWGKWAKPKTRERLFVGVSNWLGASTGPGSPLLLSSSISPLPSLTLSSLSLASRPLKSS